MRMEEEGKLEAMRMEESTCGREHLKIRNV